MKEKKEAVMQEKAETEEVMQQSTEQHPEVEQLQKEVEQKQALLDDYTSHLKRLQADFENYIKRAERERQEFQEFANQKLILSLLSIKDEFEIALREIKADENVYSGMKMIFGNLRKTLEEHGVKEITAKGALFDPSFHEAVSFATSNEHPENTIVEELQKGYTMKGRVLRYSKVVVAKNDDDANEDNNKEKTKGYNNSERSEDKTPEGQ